MTLSVRWHEGVDHGRTTVCQDLQGTWTAGMRIAKVASSLTADRSEIEATRLLLAVEVGVQRGLQVLVLAEALLQLPARPPRPAAPLRRLCEPQATRAPSSLLTGMSSMRRSELSGTGRTSQKNATSCPQYMYAALVHLKECTRHHTRGEARGIESSPRQLGSAGHHARRRAKDPRFRVLQRNLCCPVTAPRMRLTLWLRQPKWHAP